MSEQKQTVADPANGASKTTPETEGAQGDDLDTLLAQFETGGEQRDPAKTTPASKQPPKPDKQERDVGQLFDMVSELHSEKQSREREELNRQFQVDMAVVVKDVRGELDAEVFDDDMVAAWIDGQAKKNPALGTAWAQRKQKPKEFAKVVTSLARDFQKRMSKMPDKQTTEDREAVSAAVRGNSNQAPPDKKPDYKSMSNQQFADEVQKQHGFRPEV